MIYIYSLIGFVHSECNPWKHQVLEKEIHGFFSCETLGVYCLECLRVVKVMNFLSQKTYANWENWNIGILLCGVILFQLTLSKPNKWCIRNICDFTILFWPCDWDGALSSCCFSKKLKLSHLDWCQESMMIPGSTVIWCIYFQTFTCSNLRLFFLGLCTSTHLEIWTQGGRDCFTKHFRYLKWRNPHLYKLYVRLM